VVVRVLGSLAVRAGLSASFASATAARQRLDPLNLFARLLVEDGVAEVDVPVQARVRVVRASGRWVRWVRGRLSRVHSVFSVSVGRSPGVR